MASHIPFLVIFALTFGLALAGRDIWGSIVIHDWWHLKY